MSFEDKKVLITGGGSGIGLHLALQLAAAGADVLICGRRASVIEQACEDRLRLSGLVCDVSDDAGIRAIEAELRSAFGGLDLLINNAGMQMQDDLTDPATGFEGIDAEIRTNLIAPIKLTQKLLPLMAGRPGAAIVNVVSLLAVMAKPSAPVYCATKAGLLQFTRAMDLVLSGSGIRMVSAMPPLVETAMTHGRGANKMSAEDCAAEMLRQLAAGRKDIRIGQARGQMAIHRFFPALAEAITRRRSAGVTLPETVTATSGSSAHKGSLQA